jgi:hypothetical protein
MVAADAPMHIYRLHTAGPPTWRPAPDWNHIKLSLPDIDIPHPDLKYLERFVPPEKRDPTRMENASAYGDAHRDLMEANRLYGTTAGIWLAQVASLLFFLTAALVGAWTIDYLLRSGRGAVARAFCYAELYVSSLSVLIAGIALAEVFQIRNLDDRGNGPSPWPFAAVLAATLLVTVIAYVGVVRRWHWLLRVAGYVACVLGTIAVLRHSL